MARPGGDADAADPGGVSEAKRPVIMVVVFGVTLAGVAAGSWLDGHRAVLGMYFVLWGACWSGAAWTIAHNEGFLERTARNSWASASVQRQMLQWLFVPVGFFLMFTGCWMFVSALLGTTTTS